jgi:type I restriction enzyme S subunit
MAGTVYHGFEGALGSTLKAYKPSENGDFLYYYFKKNQRIIYKKYRTPNIPHVIKDFKEIFYVYKASRFEQQKIGNFFEVFDLVIQLEQKRLDLLKRLKKGFLQKMFSMQGKNIPALRFAGFDQNWEQRKLGKVVKITMGQSPNGSFYHDRPIGEILVQGNADLVNGYVKPRIWTTQITKEADKGDILMSVRAPAGEVGKTNYHVVIGRGMAAIKGNEFIHQLLTKMNADNYWKKYSTGSTFESLNSNIISSAEVKLPNLAEQRKIGTHFKHLDHLIALHQRKLTSLKKLKKGYLQKMFC